MSEEALNIIIQNYVRQDDKGENYIDFELIEPIGDVKDWYEQRIKRWGTKWKGYDLCIGETTIDFFTAWAPPIPIIRKLAELHKEMVFRLEYYECGNAYRGTAEASWKDGEVFLEDRSWDMTDKDYEELGLL
jgi:hypothetical protein